MIHSILLSLDWNTGETFDIKKFTTEKEAEKSIPKFLKRMEQDKQASPARNLKAQQIFADGKTVILA